MMTNKLSELMKQREFIRNVSIIAHVDHGKTSLTENLTHVHMDVGVEEELGITIKSAAVSLPFTRTELHKLDDNETKEMEQTYLINLIDSPGHVDFSSEVTAALRITDGAICVIDCIEGVCVQTETVLRQAILERVKPVLFMNKIDRIWLEKHLSVDDAYKLFKQSIESTNVICHTYKDDSLGDINLNPRKTNIGFGSGYFGWGFTLNHFAKIYGAHPLFGGYTQSKIIKKLWGNNYFDHQNKRWIKTNEHNQFVNGFCQFILKPIQVLHDSIMNGQSDIYLPIISALNLNITKQDIDGCNKPKEILKLVMSEWLPAKHCVLDLCADHLPSPIEAQRYRIPKLYTGPLETKEGQSMKLCDPNGTLSMYISKMIPIKNDPGRFIAFGRVFSGTIKSGQELRILGQDYDANQYQNDEEKQSQSSSNKATMKKVTGIRMMMGSKYEIINECGAGNVCGIMGIDKHLLNSGTVCDSDEMFPFETMKFSVSPVVNVAVSVVEQKNLKKLIEGLQKLAKIEIVCKIQQNKQGQQIVAGTGELHLRTCLNTLKDELMNGVDINISNPIVSFCEGIENKSGSTQTLPPSINMKQTNKLKSSNWHYPQIMCSKSANKHNHIYLTSEPLSNDICDGIEFDKIPSIRGDMKEFGRIFKSKFALNDNSWSKDDAANIWTFGCPPYGKPNCLVDETKGIQNMDKIKASLIQGFIQVTNGGILADEPLRGIRYNLCDASWKIHSDPSHRGPGQIIPCIVRACYAGQLSSTPILLEPMYCVDIEVPLDAQNGVFNTLSLCRGEFVNMTDKTDIGIPLARITGYVPILETLKNEEDKKLGFTELLRENTKGKAFPVMKFSHWQSVNGDPLINGSISNQFIMDIRKRKGMKLEIPSFHEYYDKL